MKQFNLPLKAIDKDVFDSTTDWIFPARRIDQAAAIVLAVNHHDELVKALSELLADTNPINHWGCCLYCENRHSEGHIETCVWNNAANLTNRLIPGVVE